MEKDQNYRFSIENALPSEFIYQLGVYLQTCAHIELATAALVTCLGGKDPEDEDWFKEYCHFRKLGTNELIKALRSCREAADKFGFAEELLLLTDWLSQFKEYRHTAVHGAFFGSRSGFLRVDYVQKSGPKAAPEFSRQTEAITQDLVHEALLDADRINLILLGMLGRIETDLPMRIHQRIVPIVRHPT